MDFTFLTEDQIWGDDALDVIKKYGTAVAPTDLAAILGGTMNFAGGTKTSERETTCSSWSSSSDDQAYACCDNLDGGMTRQRADARRVSARPVLSPSEASKISPREAMAIAGIRVVEYGEYPQTVAEERTRGKLEELWRSKSLRPTGKNYTFDSVDLTDFGTSFKAKSYQEYEMDGRKFIRVPGRTSEYDYDSKLSTGEDVVDRRPYWVEVQPIEWLMDRSGTMVAKKCLFSGIQFDTKSSYDGDFSKTFMKYYLDTYFAKEMEPIERVANREESKNIENSEMITSKISLLRAVVAPNVSKKKGVVNPKMSAKEKVGQLNKAARTLLGVKVKDITD